MQFLHARSCTGAQLIDLHTVFARVGWPAMLVGQILLVFAFVALSSPGRIDIVDGQTRYEVARSIVDHGDSIIRDKSSWFFVYKGREGQTYTGYRIPQSALGAAAIVLADATGPTTEVRRQFFFTLISPCMVGLLAFLYAIWFRSLGYTPFASIGWGIAGIFCTPSWYYGTSTFDDILGTTAIVAAAAAMWLARPKLPLVGATVAALAMAWAVNCKPPLALFVVPVVAAGYRSEVNWRRQLLPAAVVCLGVVLGVVTGMAYHAYKFPPGSDDVFGEYARQHGPLTTLNPLPGLASLALSPSCGILWYCPTLLLSWYGWKAWRRKHLVFCQAVLSASALFALSICYLPFFKGEPCWGPRYLTPLFALWWIFVPAALLRVRASLVQVVLALGLAVQVLALSVDPIRMFLQLPLPWSYYYDDPWLGFNGRFSHLARRPGEIMDVLAPSDAPAAEYSPGSLPTHAGRLTTAPPLIASLTGLMASPASPASFNATVSVGPSAVMQWDVFTHGLLRHYHIFNAPRPWVFNQWYLNPEQRPADLSETIALLVGAAVGGLALIYAGRRLARRAPQDNTVGLHGVTV
jgi:hypothetical protein